MNHCQRSSFSSTFSLYDLPCALGIYGYLSDASSDLSHGALDALPILLARAPPSVDLLATLKRPFNNEVISRTPSASHRAMTSIHKYLMVSTCTQCTDNPSPSHQQHDPEYQEGKHATLFVGHSEPGEDLVDCVMFLHQTENEIPRWVDVRCWALSTLSKKTHFLAIFCLRLMLLNFCHRTAIEFWTTRIHQCRYLTGQMGSDLLVRPDQTRYFEHGCPWWTKSMLIKCNSFRRIDIETFCRRTKI